MLISVSNFFNNPTDTIFWASAILGTTLFVLRMLMTLLGGALEVDDADLDSFDGADEHHYHSGRSFKLFSLHSLSGFFMMFGWVGLACNHQFEFSYVHSCMIAFAAGIALMVLTALILHGALLLQAPGAQFSIDSTIGFVATVYQRIPSHGQGKIHVVVDGVTRELLAQSRDNKTIQSFTLVMVTKAIDQDTVEVVQL